MSEYENEWYAWIDDAKLYKRDDTASDWQEYYPVRRHWSPSQTYPVELLLRSLGSGLSPSLGSEGFLAVLLLDQRMTGFAADRFSRMPFTANLPEGSN